MMRGSSFLWKAVDAQGKIQKGVLEFDDPEEVRIYLRQMGYYPISIKVQLLSPLNLGQRNVEWGLFARRLATMLEAGVPLAKALEILSLAKGKDRGRTWLKLKAEVEKGCDLSEALLKMNPPPSQFVCTMIKAGERTGELVQALQAVADEWESKQEFKRNLGTALVYPSLLLFTAVLVLYVFSVWLLPVYEKLFAGFAAELPPLTRALFWLGRRIPATIGLCTALSLGVILYLRVRHKGQGGGPFLQYLRRLPVIGTIVRLSDLGQFSSLLSKLLAAGIPLMEALALTKGTVISKEIEELIGHLILAVNQGRRLTPVLRTSKVFPAEACEMLAVGEESGKLDQMLGFTAEMFRGQLEEKLARAVRLIEPALVLAMACLVGLLAAGILLPVFDATTHFQ